MAIDFKTVERFFQLAKKYKLAELEFDDGKFKIHFKTSRSAGANLMSQPVAAAAAPQSYMPPSSAESGSTSSEVSSHKTQQQVTEEGRYHKVLSPFVGTFYRAPSPEADPYVKEGQVIRKGDVLCIVEAMKLMNEIESEISGKIVSCLAENGQPVEYGEPLFLVDPL